MSLRQAELLPEVLQNFIVSSEMGGITVDNRLKEMCLAVIRGEVTLAECLAQIKGN